ncbi:hypothetical protein [Variovorax sp. IB41]|uniref:hypothetical protein n=1 Tax=Variovorax sp. IB41 TaxID=2779370 RepID=UPI0018E79382|nr:hypothetical protein [Variovorax sp. IB41]MBJ2157797.1 hypothetical protein [Variovorax sp. IB41]
MGRAIIISLDHDATGHSASLSAAYATGVFEVITEGTRKQFKPTEQGCLRACFLRLDEEFQEYINLDEISAECFNVFVRACESGLANYQATGTTAWGFKQEEAWVHSNTLEWSELIKKLHADPRYELARLP